MTFDELITRLELDKKCNTIIELNINITEVLKHGELERLFEILQKKKIVKFKNKDEWVNKILENYKKIYKVKEDCVVKDTRYVWNKIKFNIKNNILWKNEKIDFNDTVYHELFIPYKYKSDKEEQERFVTGIEDGLKIRIFIINGILKLQVGSFNKETSPQIIREGLLGVYQTHVTITSFPIMYIQHEIPEKYLNLSAYATKSWKNMYSATKEKAINFPSDWRELSKEIINYNYVRGWNKDTSVKNYKRFIKVIKEFSKKEEVLLKKEGFKNLSHVSKENDYAPSFFEDHNIHYANKYLRVFISDYNNNKEKLKRYIYTDYYEERP